MRSLERSPDAVAAARPDNAADAAPDPVPATPGVVAASAGASRSPRVASRVGRDGGRATSLQSAIDGQGAPGWHQHQLVGGRGEARDGVGRQQRGHVRAVGHAQQPRGGAVEVEGHEHTLRGEGQVDDRLQGLRREGSGRLPIVGPQEVTLLVPTARKAPSGV